MSEEKLPNHIYVVVTKEHNEGFRTLDAAKIHAWDMYVAGKGPKIIDLFVFENYVEEKDEE